MPVQNLQLGGGKETEKPDVEANMMLLLSQACSVRTLAMRHDALPPSHLGALASLQSLTHVLVRYLAKHLNHYA